MGGENLLKGLEFSSIASVQEKGELEEFTEILKRLEKRHDVKSVGINVGNLPEGRKGKRFSKLRDGLTERKYAIGKIIMMNGRECSVIEVVREDKALSMLLIKANGKVRWNLIYSKLLLGLVDGSGTWSNESCSTVENCGGELIRIKHTNKDVYYKELKLYEKLS